MRTASFSTVAVVVTVISMLPTAVAKEIQWLPHRSAREAGRVAGQVNWRSLDLTDEKPEGVELTEFQNDRPLFARRLTPVVQRGLSAYCCESYSKGKEILVINLLLWALRTNTVSMRHSRTAARLQKGEKMMEKVKPYSVIMAVLWFLSLGSFAGAEDAGESAEPERRVTGVVKDQAGNPVAGVRIAVMLDPGHQPTALTDAAGKFDIGGWKRLWEHPDGICLIGRQMKLNLAARLDLPRGSNREDIEFQLAPAISLRGMVTDPDNKPIGGAKVSIQISGWDDVHFDSAFTDIMGR
ncbi:MAG: carboxypeptidase-like regulatory domain-containing protein, partial [Planctomycetota bacterium]